VILHLGGQRSKIWAAIRLAFQTNPPYHHAQISQSQSVG
jgi:hypothetical protein